VARNGHPDFLKPRSENNMKIEIEISRKEFDSLQNVLLLLHHASANPDDRYEPAENWIERLLKSVVFKQWSEQP
jgi:hypothetical protein